MSVLELDWLQVAVLLGSGLIAGFINTLAGGGSLLTIPALIFAGMPSTIANATNRVSVIMQSSVAAVRFKQKKVFEFREAAEMLIPSFLGAITGAFIAAELDQRIFDIVLGIVLILMLFTLFLKPAKIAERGKSLPSWLTIPVFFFIGIYGGFIQAGVGFLLITGISLLFGHDLVKTNALKLLVVAIFSVMALVIFAIYGQVLWFHGMILGIGTMSGALIGVRFAVSRGAGAVRWVVVAAVLLSALKLFGVFG